MKKIIFIFSILLFFVLAVPTFAVKNSQAETKSNNAGQQGINQNTDIGDEFQEENETVTPGSENKEDNKGRLNAEIHRSTVANFVQNLLSVADREGGIGEQVRVIAQKQNDSDKTTTGAIGKIEKRSAIKTFLLGTDYKNIGALRSEMVKTRNQIGQLNRLIVDAESEQSKVELQTQIQYLEQEQTNIDSFISQNENKFSLFGWAIKLFQK